MCAQQLLAVDSGGALSIVDTNTGAREVIGTVSNASIPAALAFDPLSQAMFLSSNSNDSLYTLDVRTGVTTLVGSYGYQISIMHGLEVDPRDGSLYGIAFGNALGNALYSINKTTGRATPIGPTGLSGLGNLCFHLGTNTMYCTDTVTDSLYQIDLATAAVTLIGPLLGPTSPNGLAYHWVSGQMYLMCNFTDRLYVVDPSTGQATAIGPVVVGNVLGLAYTPNIGEVTRHAHACGALAIQTIGLPIPGRSISTTVSGGNGLGLIGYSLNLNTQQFCSCTVGHDWAAALFGSSHTFALPSGPAFVGFSVGVQAADFGGTGGCATPQLSLSDTMVITIG